MSLPGVEITALVDVDRSRLLRLAKQFGLKSMAFTSHREAIAHVDAVILAAPNALHAPIGLDMLSRGVHVLCEKPLASTSEECNALCVTARSQGAVLAVGFVTRFFPSLELTKQLLNQSLIGRIRSFDYEFGTAGGWQTASGYNLSRASSGGGVLVVSGTHFVDRMLYLFGDATIVRHQNDSRGGVEANCVLEVLVTRHRQTIPGRITLSKTHQLANRLQIVGDLGSLEIGERQSQSVTYLPADTQLRHEIRPVEAPAAPPDYFRVQLQDFIAAVRSGGRPRVDGEQGSRSVAFVEGAYRAAAPLAEPWCDATLSRLWPLAG
jgi:predicted dehydrogenase